VWLLATAIVAVPMLIALKDAATGMSNGYPGFLLGSIPGGVDQIADLGFGAIGSMLAGLNVQISARGSVGMQSASAVGTVSLAPLLMLVIFAVILGRRTMSAARARPGTTLAAYLRPAIVAAIVTSLALYVATTLLTSSIGGTLDSAILDQAYELSYKGGPTLSGLLLTLFPALLVGGIVGSLLGGGWPHLVAWITGRAKGDAATRTMALLPLTMFAGAGYIVGLLIASVAGLVAALAWAAMNNVDIGQLLPFLPAAIVLAPNAAAVLMLAGTGTSMGFSTVTSDGGYSSSGMVSLWGADLPIVLFGVAALLLPGVIAGVMARSRRADLTPGLVSGIGAVVGIILLLVAVLAVPSLSASGNGAGMGASGSAKFVFDLGQAVLVGGIAAIGSAIVGYRFSGGMSEPVASQLDRLPGPPGQG
jgi:hypothetical protein